MRPLIASIVTAAALTVASAAPERQFEAAEIRADFAELYQRLAMSHFDLYVRQSKPAYNALFRSMQNRFDRPMTGADVRVAFQKFMAFGHVAHARIEFPSEAYGAYRDAGGRAMPVYVKVVKGRVFVTENGSGAALAPGVEILALNGTPIAAWLTRLSAHVSADNDYMMHTLLENRFAQLLWLELGPVAQFTLTVRDARGVTRDHIVAAQTREETKAALARQAPTLDLDWDKRTFKMVGKVGYLRPGPFYNNDPNTTNIWDTTQFQAFIDGSFEALLRTGAHSLVIDLRNNPGGDNSFSDLMVTWFANKTFRFCRDFRIRQSGAAVASNRKRVEQAGGDPDAISSKLAAAYAAHRIGDVFSFEIPETKPRAGERFMGKVYLLINRHSYSNAVQVAALAQDYGFATIVGEETSDLATTFGAMEQFTLTRTGIEVGFPKAQIIRVNGDTQARGVVPDIAIETPLVEPVDDLVSKRALEIAGGR
ncbi:MAG: hypothetical protein KBA31_01685 [Alphaproteobacteria bacterium]|nr:hypothetical protein [Alphaproteobacteria bacterium]